MASGSSSSVLSLERAVERRVGAERQGELEARTAREARPRVRTHAADLGPAQQSLWLWNDPPAEGSAPRRRTS